MFTHMDELLRRVVPPYSKGSLWLRGKLPLFRELIQYIVSHRYFEVK